MTPLLLLQHSMIYFFHHYELPAILQQIRIQEMLLQNQQAGQAGQANQTALQDNLNNNHNAAAPAPVPGPEPGPANTTQPGPLTNLQPPPSSLAIAGGGGEMRSELNWVAQTAAIITEALSNQQPSSTGSVDELSGGQGAAGGQGVEEVSMVAEFWIRGGGEDPNDDPGEMKSMAGGSNLPVGGDQPQEVGPSEVGPPQTDCPPTQSQDIDWNCSAAEQGPAL